MAVAVQKKQKKEVVKSKFDDDDQSPQNRKKLRKPGEPLRLGGYPDYSARR